MPFDSWFACAAALMSAAETPHLSDQQTEFNEAMAQCFERAPSIALQVAYQSDDFDDDFDDEFDDDGDDDDFIYADDGLAALDTDTVGGDGFPPFVCTGSSGCSKKHASDK